MQNNSSLYKANWIWLKQDTKIAHQYVCFRKQFDLRGVDCDAVIDISADSDFILYLNGNEMGRGQFSDYPQSKTFTRLQAGKHLQEGKNVIAVLAYHRGENFSDYSAGKPGLALALNCGDRRILSDSSFKCMQHPAFASGPMPKVTIQQGFTTCFDARSDIPFVLPDFDDSRWGNAEILAVGTEGFWKSIEPRPVPMLKQEDPIKVTIPFCGVLKREREYPSYAETMANDALITVPGTELFTVSGANPIPKGIGAVSTEIDFQKSLGLVSSPPKEDTDGIFYVIDFGKENVGLITFEIETPSGTVLDIGHGEHLEDGRVRTFISGRNFADRYLCKAGRNSYTLPFRRIGGRYLQVHVTNFESPVTIHYFGLKPLSLPDLESCRFRTCDNLTNNIHDIGLRTLKLCMHEHFEDTPWREQSLYAFDARNQALYGYYAFGNYDFASVSFDLLGRGIRDDGLLELCAPAEIAVTIPIFSLVWITALFEHWMHSGSSHLFETFSGQIKQMVRTALAAPIDHSGLYSPPNTPRIWHFYEWTPGLEGKIGNDDITGEIHAAYNLFLHEALGSYAHMLEMSGGGEAALAYQQVQRDLGTAIHKNFWGEETGQYATVIKKDRPEGFHQLIQVLALYCGIVPKENEGSVLKTLSNPVCQEITLSSAIYLLKAFVNRSPESRNIISSFITEHWEPMIFAGATTCWETQYGAADFEDAGSLCHGWSSLPVYYYHAYVLGIRPLSPGFKEFIVSPYCDRFHEAEGEVATPFGKITVTWRKDDSGVFLNVTGPDECKPRLQSLPEITISEMKYNGKRIRSSGISR